MRLAGSLVSLGLAVALAAPAPAAALPPGVFADPGSPAGKEYSFPLGSQRGEAVGHVEPAGLPVPLFGVGIAAPGASLHGARPRGPGRSGGVVARSNPATRPRPALSSRAGTAPSLEVASLTRPRSTTSQLVLITASLLLVALALGGALDATRRRRRG
jgi:hypothetical protein